MTTALQHADRIMAVKPGQWIMCCEAVEVVNTYEGGMVKIAIGDKVRCQTTTSLTFMGVTEGAVSIAFGPSKASAFEAVK